MPRILFFIFFSASAFACMMLSPGPAHSQYQVTGVVEFSYRDFETSTGNNKTSTTYWTQDYRANLLGHLADPRFLRFNAGVGYSVYSYTNSPDLDILQYSLSTSFFPNMKVSWDLFGSKSINRVENTSSIAGYDVETTTYGGTVNLNLAKGRRGNNVNNGGNGWMSLPTMSLSQSHTESNSTSASYLLSETRDDSSASLSYRPTSRFSLSADASLQQYENLIDSSRYETKQANILNEIIVAPDVNFRLNGRLNDRTTQNIATYESSDTWWEFDASLDFKEKDGIQHYYRYDVSGRKTDAGRYSNNIGEARVVYRISKDLRFRTGLDYNMKEYVRYPSGASGDMGEDSSLENGGLVAGLLYRRQIQPRFMGPFAIDTAYDFGTGFSEYKSLVPEDNGRGWYYKNDASVTIGSTGWDTENVSLTYHFSNQEDNSPVQNDWFSSQVRFFALSTRVKRTAIRASVDYTVQENTNQAGNIFFVSPGFGSPLSSSNIGTNQNRRSFTYDFGAEYSFPSYVTLTAGASRGKSTTNYFTLSTLPPSYAAMDDEFFYATADLVYPVTRRLLFRAKLREEYRTTQADDVQSHQIEMNLDYRFRMIFITLEYRIRQDIPDNSLRTTQQYYYAKLSRPF